MSKMNLSVCVQNLKEQQSRQDQFSQGPVASTMPPSAMTGFHVGKNQTLAVSIFGVANA